MWQASLSALCDVLYDTPFGLSDRPSTDWGEAHPLACIGCGWRGRSKACSKHAGAELAWAQEARAASTAWGRKGAKRLPSFSAMLPSMPCVYSRSSLSSICSPYAAPMTRPQPVLLCLSNLHSHHIQAAIHFMTS